MVVFPSILEKTSEELFAQIKKLSKYYSHFQIDIADGIFVQNKTVQIEEITKPVPYSFEFHLMVKDYKTELEKLKKLRNSWNIKTVLVHASLFPDYTLLTTKFPEFSFGLVLNPEDSVETIKTKYNFQNIPIIQIMSIHPGVQENPFLPEVLQKVEQLRTLGYRNKIALDGAINEKTIPLILAQKYLPDVLCPGSYLTKAENVEDHVRYLTEKVAE